MINHKYFNKRDEYKQYAITHTEEMAKQYTEEIQYSIQGSEILSGPDIIEYPPIEQIRPTVEYWDLDTVSAIFKAFTTQINRDVWVLNFASYKHPGGMFLQGSSAQEECLCRESFLYNVLSADRFKEYYAWNRENLNRGLYKNRMIISPNVVFKRYLETPIVNQTYEFGVANVITCAAPNYSVGLKYKRFTKEENDKVLLNRIRFILSILGDGRIGEGNTLILGAFGCGVFAQSPEMVALDWVNNLYLLNKKCRVIFAVPSRFPESIYFKEAASKWDNNVELRSALLERFKNKG